MMRKIVSLLVILAMVISFAQTTYALPEDELILKLKNATNDTIVKTFCEDFNGDGFNEMFAFTGTKIDGEIYPDTVSGSLWFVSNDSISKIEEDHGIGFVLSGDMAPTFLHIGNTIQFQYQTMLGNWDTHSTVCSVNNDSVISSYFSGYLMKRDNQYVVNQTSYDGWVNKADFHKGAYFGVGRTWKDYWYYFDESTLTFKEYGAVEITKEQFEEFNGATEILSNINGTVHNILYRGNGIININILKDAGEEYELLNVLIGYDSSKVWIIDNKQDYISVEGHYLPALNYYMAVYPEFKSPQIKVVLNGEEVEFDQPPVMINDRVMVPIRAIFEAMGYSVNWDGDTQTAEAIKSTNKITVQINNSIIKYTINGKSGTYECDVVPQIISERTLVPVRAIAESAGCDVQWDGENTTVIITYYENSSNQLPERKVKALLLAGYDTQKDVETQKRHLDANRLSVDYVEEALSHFSVNEITKHYMEDDKKDMSVSEFVETLQNTFKDAADNDLSIIYYSGHTYTDHTTLFSGITFQEFYDYIKVNIKGTVLLMYDGCYAGELMKLNNYDERIKIIAVCDEDDYASAAYLFQLDPNSESTQSCSIFAYALRNGAINNKNYLDSNSDKLITFNELYIYLLNSVYNICDRITTEDNTNEWNKFRDTIGLYELVNLAQVVHAYPDSDETPLFAIE